MSNKVQEFLKNIDKGFYSEAKKGGPDGTPLTAGAYMAKLCELEPEEIDPVYKRLLKRFKAEDDGSSFSISVRDFAGQVAALSKCLSLRGIKTRGQGSDRVEKFFSSTNDSALFPVFMATEIIAGQLATSLVPRLAAAETRINSHVAEKITLTDTAADRTLRTIDEGVNIPKTKISRAEGSIPLWKYGRMLEFTYESARLMKLNIISLFFQRMGIQIGIDETDDLIETLIAGDGTAGSAAVDTDAEVSGTLDYDELIRLSLAFPTGYSLTDAVWNDTQIRTVLNMPEFKDPMINVRFQERGIQGDGLPLMGGTFHRWSSTGSPAFATDRILAVDRNIAVEVVREGDLLEESDRIIEKQLNQRTVTEWVGYKKLDNNATQVLDITT